ncbi:cytochrome c [Haloferula helveola]|uniref:Cytochrome c n=1 Tax=Haloferula helveola TaxID=490095 RepID=A0ABM7RDM0_9BACT|nr:cytochrome c [Haloferula helveola]
MKTLALLLCLALPLAAAKDPRDDPNRPVATTEALSPAETAGRMELPDGFRMELIAGEPDIVQPIAYTIDDRGRLWVVECTNYPNSPGEPKDRIVVLSDNDGDGTFEDKRTFWDKAHFSSGIAVGFGGVWLGSPPNLLFLPDRDGDAVMDGEPEIVLDGWGAGDTHETLNNFIWGPDGWLYGTHGVFTHSKVGAPGTPPAERVPINAGIWRYHPTRKVFERWCEGVSNQWGVDWNDRGEAFFAACVVPHMWHAIEGAHYTRQAGGHFNPNLYEDIKTIAWGRYEKAAYCGAMVYLGGAFPDEWRDRFFFHDIHMNRLRCERFVANGSGFRSKKVTDFVVSGDPWFRGLSPQYGPDGGVFISDWYDAVPCHQQRAFTDRSNGRMYKITHDRVKPRKVDLTKASDEELVEMQLDANDWFVRHARRLLQERGAKPGITGRLEKILLSFPDETRRLRALWVLHSQGALTETTLLRAMMDQSAAVRGWAVTCACEKGEPTAKLREKMLRMAKEDPSPTVRLRLASAAQRLSADEAWLLVEALGNHEEDLDDPNLPLMVWYAAEAAARSEPGRAPAVVAKSPMPKLQRYLPRRLMRGLLQNEARFMPAIDDLCSVLHTAEPPRRIHILAGLLKGAEGHAKLPQPKGWTAAYEVLHKDQNPEIRQQALTLALLFGNAKSLHELRAIAANADASAESRSEAMEALSSRTDAASLELFLRLASAKGPLRETAVRALAVYDDPKVATLLVDKLSELNEAETRGALEVLAARPAFTLKLLEAIDSGKLPGSTITAPVARLIQGHKDAKLDQWLEQKWGTLNPTDEQRQKEIERYRRFLGEPAILSADVKNGAEIFKATCSACHEMFGEGGHIGPHLPGNFSDVEYLLQNLLDPNAVIGRDYQQSFVTLDDDSLVAGIVTEETDGTLTLKTLAGTTTTLPKSRIRKRELSPRSMMPEGLLNSLSESQVRDLFLYLRQPEKP